MIASASAPATPPTSRSRLAFWLGLAGCIALLAERRTDAFVRPQFWAEDAFFFERNYTAGLTVIFEQYNGYLHLAPRLIALIASWFDPLFAPAFFVYLSLASTVYVAARTFSPRFPLPFHPVLMLAVALVPNQPDVLLNPTNLQSILNAGLVLLLISRDPESPLQIAHDLIALVILALTGPASVLFAPLFALRVLIRRTRWSLILGCVAGICAAIQFSLIIAHPLPPEPPEYIKPALALPVIGSRMAGSLFLGARVPVADNTVLFGVLGVLMLLLIGVLAWWPRNSRVERSLLAGSCLLLLVGMLFRMRHAFPETMEAGFGARYFFTPQLIVLWLLATLLPHPGAFLRRGAAALLVLALAMNVKRLQEPSILDLHWADYAAKIRNHEKVTVPINPDGWHMTLNEGKK